MKSIKEQIEQLRKENELLKQGNVVKSEIEKLLKENAALKAGKIQRDAPAPKATTAKLGEFEGKPIVEISGIGGWRNFSLGKAKCQAVLKHIDLIKQLANS